MTKARDFKRLSPKFSKPHELRTILSTSATDNQKLMSKMRFALDMMDNLREFSRKRCPSWPHMIRHENEIVDAYEAPDDDNKRRVRGYWGRHRSDVTNCESENDSRLGTLCWARDVFREAGGAPSVPLIAALDRHLRAEFDISPSEIPEDMYERVKWCRQKTRDYSALPRRVRQL